MARGNDWLGRSLVRVSLALSNVADLIPLSTPGVIGLLAGTFATLPCVVAAAVGVDSRANSNVANKKH